MAWYVAKKMAKESQKIKVWERRSVKFFYAIAFKIQS